ncbi:MAG: homoserine dehydrogenase [Sedimentisphaerales bacterium]|nr:homoserine dehydrogenase [Sedimentisphaerales bacterium]
MSKSVKIVLCGLGNVGKALLELLAERSGEVESRYGLHLILSAAVDIGGAAVGNDEGLPTAKLLEHLKAGGAVESFSPFGQPGKTGKEVIDEAATDVLLETTPTTLVDGEPGRTHIFAALEQGMDVVSANKGPIVLFYQELHELARQKGCGIHISAATAAALPTLDVGQVCLAGATLLEIEGILNGSTNYILTRMQQDGSDYEVALKEAQELGIAETDPRLDVEGRDTANKIVLIANRLFGLSLGPKDISVEGITHVTPEDVAEARDAGQVIKLIGTAKRTDKGVQLSVGPKRLDQTHPLASVSGSEKAISYLTDTMHRITVSGGKSSPVGAAAAMLKDLINAF